jgi:hypothetical protein
VGATAVPESKALRSPKPAHSKNSFDNAPPEHIEATASFAGAIARAYWMLAGNAVLSLLAIAIVQRGRERAWTIDATFWVAGASLVLVRYVDITRFRGATASGKPASLADWYRYAGRLLLVSLTVWILVHAIAWMTS